MKLDEKKKIRDLISEISKDFGISLIAASLAISYYDYRYWYSLIFGTILLIFGIRFKFIPLKKINERYFRSLLVNWKKFSIFMFVVTGVVFLLNKFYIGLIFLGILGFIIYYSFRH